MGTMKDLIRERGLSERNISEKVVEVAMAGIPTKVIIRQPSMKVRRNLSEIGRLGKGQGIDINAVTAMKVEAVIACVVDDEGKPCFDAIDRAKLETNVAAGGWVDTLADQVLAYMHGTTNPTCAELGADGKVCGAELPPQAVFCPKCGKRQLDAAEMALKNSVTT